MENSRDEDCLTGEGNSKGLLGYEMQRNGGGTSVLYL